MTPDLWVLDFAVVASAALFTGGLLVVLLATLDGDC